MIFLSACNVRRPFTSWLEIGKRIKLQLLWIMHLLLQPEVIWWVLLLSCLVTVVNSLVQDKKITIFVTQNIAKDMATFLPQALYSTNGGERIPSDGWRYASEED